MGIRRCGKRRHAQRGRDDIVVTDYHGRAVCFASGDPTGLPVTLPGALAQLRMVLGADAKTMLGFDRGGSYPGVFRACQQAGAHWLTWWRGELAVAHLLRSDRHHTTINKAIPAAQTWIATAQAAVHTAKTEHDAHPAKLPANVIDPDAKRARLRTYRRALQMTLRLLATTPNAG